MVGCTTCADFRSGPTVIVGLHQYILLRVNMGRGSDRVRMAADVFIPPLPPTADVGWPRECSGDAARLVLLLAWKRTGSFHLLPLAE